MTRRKILILLFALLLVCIGASTLFYLALGRSINFAGFISNGRTSAIRVPPGFKATLFASDLNGPRFIHFGPDGVLYVADRRNNRIVALPDKDNNGRADEIRIFAAEINLPHSLVYHEGAWYVGVPSGLIRLENRDGDGRADFRTTLIDSFTPPGQHSTRTVEFFPDGRLLISAGSTCNVCDEEDPRRAAITVYDNPAGQNIVTGERLFASGIRNAVGLAIHPETGELWASNNGRDLMGDDLPPETIYIVRDGGNYGWPTCHNGHIVDPDMGFAGACEGVEPPLVEMQAHMAPLDIAFYNGTAFPETYQGDLFIAQHGSWNRSELVGYKISRLPLDGSVPTGPVEDFATGWLDDDGSVNGRPVGLVVGPDGALYVSDDTAGLIYRIIYEGIED
ncbi:MAG: sorbosone dehydrogenase family protein [Chloroflexi bacterium]|nr:sorbosone dehydrogenase family protein [Chloroflexota bacterium]